MKSFRLYLRPPVITPRRVVADYRPEELTRFREEFLPIAERYRRYGRIGYSLVFLGATCILSSWAFPRFFSWLLGGFFACWLAIMLLVFLSPVPKCPACHNALDQGIGAYCPECGAHAIQRASWFLAPSCSSCGRAMSRRKARHYTIRACTYCGVPLDEKGI